MNFLDILRNKLNELHAQREALCVELEQITDAAATEQRSELTPDESARFEALTGQIADLDNADKDGSIPAVERRIGELEAIEQRRQASAMAPINVNLRRDPFDLSDLRYGAGRAELHSRARAALDEIKHLSAEEAEAAETTMRRADNGRGDLARRMLITGRPAYRSAFEKVMSGNEYALTDVERGAMAEMRAASLADAAGGYAVPFTLDPTIINVSDGSVNPLRQLGTIKQTVTSQWAAPTVAAVTASYDGEATEVSDDAPTVGQVDIPVEKAQAFIPYSIEIGMDWPNMEAEFRALLAEAKDDLEADKFINGVGRVAGPPAKFEPTGLITALDGSTAEMDPATPETFAVGDVYALEEALPAKHRNRASWLANKAIYNDIRQFGTSDSHALWERLGAGQPAQLLGYPAYEASAMPAGFDASTNADNFILVFGDFRYFYIVDRIGLVVDVVPHLFGTGNNLPTGQRGLYAFWRNGSDVVKPGAFAVLNVATTE